MKKRPIGKVTPNSHYTLLVLGCFSYVYYEDGRIYHTHRKQYHALSGCWRSSYVDRSRDPRPARQIELRGQLDKAEDHQKKIIGDSAS